MYEDVESIRGRFPSKQYAEEICGNVTAGKNHSEGNFIHEEIPGHI
jgi:hypothetical protein